MSIKLSIRQMDDVNVVDVSGRLTLSDGSSALRDALRAMASAGRKKILLNFKDVFYIDSSGLGALVSSYATLTHQGVQLKLLNLTNRVKDLLMITKLLTVFEAYDDEATAVRSFIEVAAGAQTSRG